VEPTTRLTLPDGRLLAVDDVGDPTGWPVLYLHGTPDSRLARHPDDGLAAACGVRLLAVDRPGSGGSTPHPEATLCSIGRDLAALLDHLGLEGAALLGWSAGGLFALAAATVLGPRAQAVSLVGPVPPVEAYADPAVVAALSPSRRHFVEMAAELPVRELGEELAPYLVPQPLSTTVAVEHVLEGAGEVGRAELSSVPGATEHLALALAESVAAGLGGLAHDIALQLEAGLDLAAVQAPVRTMHGTEDPMSPPAVGEGLHAHLPRAALEVVAGAGHHLIFPRWTSLLTALATDARGG
jgi:pimeloyl-ACP methyl ester carboxylesterase